jgi:thiol-disulfide isomerase/thioredoxin|tara:strand:+ start:1061 stop:1591 length:531 start_codon:yes stop_codon:yes gene_type:complete
MKILTFKFFIILLYLLSSSASYAIQEPSLKNLFIHKNQKKLENVKFKNTYNETISLNSFRNSLVLVNFWATWCAPCREEMPSLNALQKNENFKNLKIIPINVGKESLEKSKDFFNELNINNLEIYYDMDIKLAKQFLLRGLPTTVFINKNGDEFARVIGSINFEDEKLIQWLKNFD